MKWTPEKVAAFWEFHVSRKSPFFAEQAGDQVISFFARYLNQDVEILDFGCGSGALVEALLSKGYRAAGFDLSEETTAALQKKLEQRPGFLGVVAPSQEAAFGQQFDIVFLLEVIEHLDDVPLTETINRCKRFLKPNGLLIVTTPNEENLDKSVLFCPECRHTFHPWQHVRSWSAQALSDRLRASDFDIVELGATHFVSKWHAVKMLAKLKRRVFKQYPLWPNLYIVCSKGRCTVPHRTPSH